MFIVIGQNVWGKGETEEEARRNAEQQNGGKMARHLVYTVGDAEAYVTDMGDIAYDPKQGRPVLVKKVAGRKVIT